MATLAANLASRYSIAHQQLPNLADQFDAARGLLDAVGDTDTGLSRGADLGSGPLGCHAEFQGFSDQIVALLQSTARNLYDTGLAVEACAKDYAHQDTRTAAEFKKLTGVI